MNHGKVKIKGSSEDKWVMSRSFKGSVVTPDQILKRLIGTGRWNWGEPNGVPAGAIPFAYHVVSRLDLSSAKIPSRGKQKTVEMKD
jgi:hypothetical protein